MQRLSLILSIILLSGSSFAQSALRQFEGIWYCTTEKRYLEIFIDATDSSRVTINDWSNIPQRKVAANTDAYSAFYRDHQLIVPAGDKEHRAPYCALRISEGRLYYSCNGALNNTDQFLTGDQYSTTLIFTRSKAKKQRN